MPPLRRLGRAGAVAFAGVCIAVQAAAPARGAATGAVTGVVVNRSTGRPQEGVEVVLRGGMRGAAPRLHRSVRTGASGRFRFDALPTGAERYYAVDARFRRGLFTGGVVRLPGDTARAPVVDTRVSVWPTTTDPAAVLVARDLVFVLRGRSGLGAVESVTIANTSKRAYIGRAPTSAGASPTFGFALPPAAEVAGVTLVPSSTTIEIPELRPSDFGFATTVAIPPGSTKVTFSYPLRASTGTIDLSRRALYPVLDYRVHVAAPFTLRTDALERRGRVEVGGRTYTRYSAADPLRPGDVAQALALAHAGFDPGLAAAIAGGLTLAAAVGAFLLARRTSASRAPRPAEGRADLVHAIAELDLRHDAGEIDARTWAVRRAELKARLERTEPQPAP